MIKKVRILSGILGFFYCGGMVWYGDIFLAQSLPALLLLGSTGIALIITPLLSETLFRSYFIRLLFGLLLIAGIGGSLYSIIGVIKSTGFWWDLIVVMLQHVVIIAVLIILGIRIIRIDPLLKRDKKEDRLLFW